MAISITAVEKTAVQKTSQVLATDDFPGRFPALTFREDGRVFGSFNRHDIEHIQHGRYGMQRLFTVARGHSWGGVIRQGSVTSLTLYPAPGMRPVSQRRKRLTGLKYECFYAPEAKHLLALLYPSDIQATVTGTANEVSPQTRTSFWEIFRWLHNKSKIHAATDQLLFPMERTLQLTQPAPGPIMVCLATEVSTRAISPIIFDMHQTATELQNPGHKLVTSFEEHFMPKLKPLQELMLVAIDVTNYQRTVANK